MSTVLHRALVAARSLLRALPDHHPPHVQPIRPGLRVRVPDLFAISPHGDPRPAVGTVRLVDPAAGAALVEPDPSLGGSVMAAPLGSLQPLDPAPAGASALVPAGSSVNVERLAFARWLVEHGRLAG